MSEHHYDETLDLETAKTILNFGDDYRNFIESNSEVQSPRNLEFEKRMKRNKVIQKYGWVLTISAKFCFLQLENERREEGKDDSDSDDDCTDVFNIISDLKKDIEKYEDEYKIFRSKGFDNFEEPRQIVGDDQILINISVIPLL